MYDVQLVQQKSFMRPKGEGQIRRLDGKGVLRSPNGILSVFQIVFVIVAGLLNRPALAVEQSYRDLSQLGNRASSIAMSPDGSLLAIEESDQVVVLDVDSGATKITLGEGLLPVWSPTGEMLAFYSTRTGNLQIWTWSVSEKVTTQRSHFAGGIDADPTTRVSGYIADSLRLAWAPDGSKIAFASRVSAADSPATTAPDLESSASGSSPIVLTDSTPPYETLAGVFTHPAGIAGVAQIVDGRRISMRASRPQEDLLSQVFVLNLSTGSAIQISRGKKSYFNPDWSPDGSRIVCVMLDAMGVPLYEGLDSQIVLMDPNSGAYLPVATGKGLKYKPRWAPDGSMVAYMQSTTAFDWPSLYYTDPERVGSQPKRVPYSQRRIEGFDWSSDSTSLLVLYKDATSDRLGRIKLAGDEIVDLTLRTSVPLAVNSFSVFQKGEAWAQYDPVELTTIRTESIRRRHRIIARLNTKVGRLRRGQVQTIEWTNQRGDRLEGTLLLPPGFQKNARIPLIVDAYPLIGGSEWSNPNSGNFLWASLGYAVFRPSPRAPHVWMNPWKDEASSLVAKGVRGWDITVDDVLSGVDELIRRGFVDDQRMCLYGFSNGGGVVDLLVTRTNRFVCAVSVSPALSDWLRPALLMSDFPQWMAGATLSGGLSDYIGLSAVFHLADVHTPMLLAAGDREVDFLLDAVEMYNGLRRLGKTATLIRYPNQDHGFTGSAQEDFLSRELAFFDRYLSKSTVEDITRSPGTIGRRH